MKKSKRFSHSFRPIVPLKPGEVCSWKRHFRGVLRNLIGILNLWASNDPDRLVYAGLNAIVKDCKRYKGKGYSRSAVLAALRALRDWEMVSKLVTCIRFGYETTGFTVAAHDSLCVREGNMCVFRGTDAAQIWQSAPESVLQNRREVTRPSTFPTSLENTLPIALPSILPSSPQGDDSKTVTSKSAPRTFQNVLTVQTSPSAPTIQTGPNTSAPNGGPGAAGDGMAAFQSSQSLSPEDETLWQAMRSYNRNYLELPTEMINAVPRKDEKRRVVEQLKAYGVEVLVRAIETWADERDMPLTSLGTRWRAWLEEGSPLLAKEKAEQDTRAKLRKKAADQVINRAKCTAVEG